MLTNDNKAILHLSRIALFDLEWSDLGFTPDWKALWDKCQAQNITGLIASAVLKMPESDLPENVGDWKTSMLQTIAAMAKKNNEFNHMFNILMNNGITPICLKGCVIKNLYPVPELRTMGDFDILVNKEDLKKIKQLFSEAGYNIKKDYAGIVCNKNNIIWEIFTSIHAEFKINTEYWNHMFIENKVKINGICCPCITLFFIHLIVHTGKHYMGRGTGIRNLCDISLFLNKYKKDIDFDFVEKVCKEQKYYKLYCHIINAVGEWLGADTKGIRTIRTDTEDFIEYMLMNGIFGKQDNTVLSQLTKTTENENAIRKLFFPSAKTIEYRYKYLDRAPFLLPVAWIHRFFSAIFRLKLSPKQMIKDTGTAIDYSKVRDNWLKKLDVID